ncbi:MAG: hypothetical protein VB862_16495 [Pirellulaceae bacterium]
MIRLALVGDGERADQLISLVPRIEDAEVTVRAASVDQLLADENTTFDAVILLATAGTGDCEQLASAGKHLLLPISSQLSTEAIQALGDQCQQQGVCLMAGGTDRLVPALQATWQSLAAGELGKPGLVRLHRWSTVGSAGVAVTDDLLRDLDLVLNVCQALPTEVYAVARSVLGAAEPDYLQVHLGFDSGAMALIDRSSTLPPGDGYFSFSVIGSSGAAYADDHLNKQLVFRGEHPVAVGTGSDDLAAVADIQEFCRAIQQQRSAAVSGADWLAAAKIAKAVSESIASGSAVSIAGGRPS